MSKGIAITNGANIDRASGADYVISPQGNFLKLDLTEGEKTAGNIIVTFAATPLGVGGFTGGVDTKLLSIHHGKGFIPAHIVLYQGADFEFNGGGTVMQRLPAGPMFNGSTSSEWTVFYTIDEFYLDFWINHDTSSGSTTIVGQKMALQYLLFSHAIREDSPPSL